MSKTTEELFREYEGLVVPRAIHGGYVALSYFISWLGALSTLQLINRRTSRRGLFNYVLLIAAAVSMGGVSIWCMHFIGNRAIILAAGEPPLQISYSAGFTALSFFVPIIVLLLAFTAIGVGDNNSPYSWTRLLFGGSLAGCAICGMHYLGDASISNYASQYDPGYVVGAAFIAVAASNVALAVFFVFRHAWADSWWKTVVSAFVLAGAVSGMHWCAAMGTHYRLRKAQSADAAVSMNNSVKVVIVLAVVTCVVMAGTAIYTTRARMNSAKKAQQVVLAAAVFDQNGRILINRNGFLPSESITDTFLDKSSKDKFDTNHPLFHWMFRASRNWSGIQPLLDGMARHLSQLPRQGRDRDARASINLVSEHGEVMEKYDVVFRELFCVAASALAGSMKEAIADAGVLWEEVLVTGAGAVCEDGRPSNESDKKDVRVRVEDLEKGKAPKKGGSGSLMLLVRKVESERGVARLGAAGYRFVDLHQVAGHIAASMQIKNPDVEAKFQAMARYLDPKPKLQPGVHLGFFGLKPRASGSGYDVLVRKEAKGLLPSVRLPFDKLTGWQLDFLMRLEGMSAGELERRLPLSRGLSPKEMSFAGRIVDAVQDLRTWIGDSAVEAAVLTPHASQVPCAGASGHETATLIALRLVMPPLARVVSANCTLIPLSLFKVHQLTSPRSPHHLAFSRAVHRELAPIINAAPGGSPARRPSRRGGPAPSKLRKFGRLRRGVLHVDGDRNPIPTAVGGREAPSDTNRSTSTLMWDRSSTERPDSQPVYEAAPLTNLSMLGGIMISEEVTVNVQQVHHSSDRMPRRDSDEDSGAGAKEVGDAIEMDQLHGTATMRVANVEVERQNDLVTFVDELYALCMDDR